MCGIVGYVGKREARAVVLDGLGTLEYRGYDSAGIACVDARFSALQVVKSVGPLVQLREKVGTSLAASVVGVGHTRWATHGVASELNAHPHLNADDTIAVVHNGIIENFAEQKARLEKLGIQFRSDTDTEVIAHLFGVLLAESNDIRVALHALSQQLRGAFACVILARQFPEKLFFLRCRSPLCVGHGDGEYLVASDVAALGHVASSVLFLPDESYGWIDTQRTELFSFSNTPLPMQFQPIAAGWGAASRGQFEHFMLKEMFEQKRVIYDTVSYCRQLSDEAWRRSGFARRLDGAGPKRVRFIACGTSANAAEVASYAFAQVCGLETRVDLASEFRTRPFFSDGQEIICFLSQSGETADTLEAMRMVKAAGVATAAIVNVPASSMVREADGVLLTQAQREVAVASTKSFTAQVALLFWVAHKMAFESGKISEQQLRHAESELLIAAEVLDDAMRQNEQKLVSSMVPRYGALKQFIFLGRQVSYPFAREAALKLKEIVYAFVDCYPAGELKHGPLALVDSSVPVFLFSLLDDVVYSKLVFNAHEVKARSGHLVVFAFEGQEELLRLADEAFVLPKVHPLLAPLAMTGLMQLFVYHAARTLGRPIDKPRNLAKSVTVE